MTAATDPVHTDDGVLDERERFPGERRQLVRQVARALKELVAHVGVGDSIHEIVDPACHDTAGLPTWRGVLDEIRHVLREVRR